MSNIDWERVNNLLGAIHQAAAAGPKFASIASRAEAELWDHIRGPQPQAIPSAEPKEPVDDPQAEDPEEDSETPTQDVTTMVDAARRI